MHGWAIGRKMFENCLQNRKTAKEDDWRGHTTKVSENWMTTRATMSIEWIVSCGVKAEMGAIIILKTIYIIWKWENKKMSVEEYSVSQNVETSCCLDNIWHIQQVVRKRRNISYKCVQFVSNLTKNTLVWMLCFLLIKTPKKRLKVQGSAENTLAGWRWWLPAACHSCHLPPCHACRHGHGPRAGHICIPPKAIFTVFCLTSKGIVVRIVATRIQLQKMTSSQVRSRCTISMIIPGIPVHSVCVYHAHCEPTTHTSTILNINIKTPYMVSRSGVGLLSFYP